LLDNSSVDSWIRDFISKLLERGDDQDATSGAIYILRGLLDRIDSGIALSESHRQHLVQEIPRIAGYYDDGVDIADEIEDLASTINGWA
jgi:hypothetical protein